ncbi:MAG TPA: serine/threonine-protein kinase, partial [Longimicrobiaceae bacterium]|nr:serine/threonine-protein kinase [Longimicrobiaceae bacterium]
MAGIENLLVGRVLGGRYRIEEVIGRGGMGAVYRALDERLGRHVALKVITAGGTGEVEARERLRARFFREARSAAALPHHPNVVPVYDYGSDEGLGLDYLVMELLRGSDLASRLSRSGPPPLAASLKILLEAARGVAVGHQKGLIHRDIKPGNIFLTEPHRNEVQVRVVDFGIAKVADEDDTLAQLTQDGRVPHSPAYASPEQIRGLSQLTPASDVFSLGAVGFQLLTGQRPFSESDRNRLSLGMPVESPSSRKRNPAIPSAIDAVIQRALAFDPPDRFADAGEMARALEEAMRSLGDLPVEPYLAGAAIVTAAANVGLAPAEEGDDRTRLMDEEEDDRT